MNDTKSYFKFIGILVVVVVLFNSLSTILPVMDDDEFFIDENGIIHGNNCQSREVPWFTKKHSKYDILIMGNQEICTECLLLEEDKLLMLHEVNVKEEYLRLKRSGATEEYINNKMKLYD